MQITQETAAGAAALGARLPEAGNAARGPFAEAAGNGQVAERAREAWAQASGGVVRELVEAEQARARRRAQPGLAQEKP